PFRGTRVRTGPRHGGAVRPDGADAFYVLEQRRDGVLLQRGVIGALDLAGPWHGVLPHEDVLPAGVDLHHRITRLTGGCAEPVLLSHRGGPEAAAALASTAAGPADWEAIGEDGTVHRYWACTDPEHRAAIRAGTAGRTALLADGHHRFAAAQRYRGAFGGQPGPWDRVLALLVDSVRHPLRLTAIDRLVPGLDPVRAAAEAARVAQV
ncbi:DUF1015 family protein, partial [Streptomyces sp. SID5475]|nr:DUF1015 family protein [Streptomyces sp. SID5475]